MKLGFHNQGFFWKGPEFLSDIPEKFGFDYVPSVEMWYTRNPANAERLAVEFGPALEVSERVKRVIDLNRSGFVESNASDAEIDIPAPIGLEYKPFQKAGIKFITRRDATLLADEQGLGKTIQVAGAMNIWLPELTLIVCPASLKINWERELKTWVMPTPETFIIQPGDKNPWISSFEKGVVIINYDLLSKMKPFLLSINWDLVVMDEAHYIKNTKTKRTKIAVSIPGKKKVLTTGTPVLNRPIELYSLISYLDKKEWPSKNAFVNRYCDPHTEWYGGRPKLVATGASNLEELQWKLRSSIMIRRLKKDVLKDLPDKQRQVIELSGVSLKSEKEGLASITETRMNKIENLGALAAIRHETALAKVSKVNAFIFDTLESVNKIVVFAHHRDVIDQIAEAFQGVAVKITGDMSQKDRQKSVDEFQNNPDVKLFIGNMVAAGTGLTLTASSHVIFAELDWVPGVMAQAEDRCHRIGQKNSVLIQYLVVQDSIDAKLAHSLVKKSEVINQTVNIDKSSVSDEMLALITEH